MYISGVRECSWAPLSLRPFFSLKNMTTENPALKTPAATKTKATPKAASKTPRMTPRRWSEAKAIWEHGDATLGDLSRKFSVSVQELSRRFKKDGSEKGAKAEEARKLVAAELAKNAVEEAVMTASRVKETKEQHYKMSSMLAQLAWQEILTAKNAGLPIASAINNLKSLDAATNIIKKCREERWSVLGLNDIVEKSDDDEVPELLVSELSDKEIQNLRDREYLEDLALSPGQIGSVSDDDIGEVTEE